MSNCITIEVKNIEAPSSLLNGGRLLVDLSTSSTIEEISNKLELKDSNIYTDGALSINLPYSKVNDFIFRPRVDAHVADQTFSSFEVEIYVKGFLTDYKYLRIESKNDSSRSYRAAISQNKNNPINLAKELKLNQIEGYSDFYVEKSNVESQFSKYKYNDGDEGYFFPFAWFGKALGRTNLTASDLRPFFNPLSLLTKGFATLGWKFNSPILETDFFRKTWMYLSDETYGGNRAENLEYYKFLLAYPEGFVYPQSDDALQPASKEYAVIDPFADFQLFGNDFFDGHFYVTSAVHQSTYYLDFSIDVSNVSDRNQTFELQVEAITIFLSDPLNPSSRDLFKTIIDLPIDLSVDTETVYSGVIQGEIDRDVGSYGSVIMVGLRVKGIEGMVINRLKLYNSVDRLIYPEWSTIPMSEALSDDISLLDVLKGVMHPIGGHLTVDFSTNSISLDQSSSSSVPVATEDSLFITYEDVLGYNDNLQSNNISGNVLCESQVVNNPKSDIKRTQVVGFKKPKDSYVKSIPMFSNDDAPFDKKIDLGDEYDPGTRYDRNPIFEASLLKTVDIVSLSHPVTLPYLVDNFGKENDYSYDIQPRWMMASPPSTQRYIKPDGTIINTTSKINWYKDSLEEFPILYHTLLNQSVSLSQISLFFGYGSDDSVQDDFWSLFLSDYFLTDILAQVVKMDFYMNISEYVNIVKNYKIEAAYGYEYIVGLLKDLRYNYCTGFGSISINVPIETSTSLEGNIINIIDSTPCIGNNPQISESISGTTASYTLSGVNISAVSSVAFEYRAATPQDEFLGSWATLTTTGITSEDITIPSSRYQIRMTVVYADGCEVSPIILTSAHCANVPQVEIQDVFTLANKNGGRRINLNNSVFSATISTVTATVRINGGAAESYNIDTSTLYGDYIYNLDSNIANNLILETLYIEFTDGCTYTLPEPINLVDMPVILIRDAEIVEGNISCRKVTFQDGGRYIPVMDNFSLSTEPSATIVLYRNDKNVLQEFGEPWNTSVGPVGHNPQFRVAFFFEEYDTVYTDWTECS